jgi:hypothetical protein
VLPEELKFPEGATLEIKPTESPTSHEQPTEVKNGSGHKDDKEEEVKGDQQKESVSITPSESEATPSKPLN